MSSAASNASRRLRYKNDSEYRQKILARQKKQRPQANARKHRIRLYKPEARLLESAKARAKERQLPFDLALTDIVIPATCPIDGLPLIKSTGRKGPTPRSPSLDCVVPNLGYVRGNIAVISHHWNRLKCTMGIPELNMLMDYLKRFPHA